MQTLPLLGPALLAALVFAFAGCASEETHVESVANSERPPPTAAAAVAPGEAGTVETRSDVTGVLATDLDEPIAGRTITLVDAHGARQASVTRTDGAFTFVDVVAPYDLRVAAAASSVTTVYLGLRRNDPYVELFERDGPTPSPARQTLRVGLRAPACGAATCSVTAVSISPSGRGCTTTHVQGGEPIAVLEVEHGWRGLHLLPGERIDVHLLVGDEERTHYAYARLSGIAAAPGDTVDVGMVDAEPVLVGTPVTIGANGGAGAIVDWRWVTSVGLDLGGEGDSAIGTMPLATVGAASTTLRLPMIPGARVRAGVSASHPRGDGQGGFFRATEAWSGVQRLGSDAFGIDVVVGPELVRPRTGGIFSRRGLGFEWTPPGGVALATLTVVDTAHGAARFRIITNGHEVPLARLAELGLPKLELGDHLADLSTSPLVGIDDAASPDASVRRRHADRTQPGMTTYLRIPFQVTQ